MTPLQRFITLIRDGLIIISGAIFVSFPNSPANMPFAGRDAGVFLYIGSRILQGDLPYRDIWDHKPPIVFYINALGLALLNNSRWGVWWIEFFCVLAATYIGFKLIKQSFGMLSAVVSLCLWLPALFGTNHGGNYTELYALPLQLVCLWLVCDIDNKKSPHLRWFLTGVIGATAFLTKQTTIGIIVAIILYFTYTRWTSGKIRQWLRELTFFALGASLIGIGIASFFYQQGIFLEFIDATFRYSFYYISPESDFTGRANIIYGLYRLLAFSNVGLAVFAGLGYIAAFIFYRRYTAHSRSPMLLIAFIDLPIEWVLLSVSGRFYHHYYITLLPVLLILAGFALWTIEAYLAEHEVTKVVIHSVFIGIAITSLLFASGFYRTYTRINSNTGDKALVDYITNSTEADDYVLLWGAETYINYFTQRLSPTRFVYQRPLYTRGYTNENMILEFLHDIIEKKPKYIVDTGNSFTPMYDFPIKTTQITASIYYLRTHYRIVKTNHRWVIYERDKGMPW